MKTNEIIESRTDGFGSFSVFTWTENHPLIWGSFMNNNVFVISVCFLLVDHKQIRCISNIGQIPSSSFI